MSRKQDFERKCVETLAEKSIFEKTKYFIVDMDGTFYLDGNIIPGADGFLKKVRESGRDFYFFTNNSSNNVASCRNKLAKMGFPVDEKRVIISSHVTIDFLKRHRPGKSVYLLGNERLTGDFKAAGIDLVEKDPDIVVLGFDTTLTYQKLWDAAKYIANGAEYIRFRIQKVAPDKSKITVDYCDRWVGMWPPFLFWNPGPFRGSKILEQIWKN